MILDHRTSKTFSIFSLFIIEIFFIITLLSCKKLPDKVEETCQGEKSSIIVDTVSHRLWICQNEKRIKDFTVSLGRGGTYKKIQGDNKTPIGDYSLGIPRPSNRFGIFIPIGYPTQEQKIKGYTGSDVGLHGPSRPFKWLGNLNTIYDWTQGCIAVATDDEITEITRLVKDGNINRIVVK